MYYISVASHDSGFRGALERMKIYTCTPVAFFGDHTFFSRDSGLCCRGLQSIGIESRAIMPEPMQTGDELDLIRTAYANLEDANWWKNLNIDGLVLYSWADPKYTRIAKAVKTAGIKLFVNMDTGGLITPYIGFKLFWNALFASQNIRYGRFVGRIFSTVKFCRALLPLVKDIPRIDHLKNADAIGAISPIAQQRIQSYLTHYGHKTLAARVVMIPHPVNMHFEYSGQPKCNRIICVGRWDDPVKDVSLAISAIAYALTMYPDYTAVFIGSGSEQIRRHLNNIHPQLPIDIIERVKNYELVTLYATSKVSFCSSVFESGHIVSEEALCCGCSVVAPVSPSLPSMPYYVGQDSGQLGPRTTVGLGKALCMEIEAWNSGHRDPASISTFWCEQLRAEKIAARIVKSMELKTTE